MKLRITYEVDDGYVGKSRPQYFTFDSEEWCEEWDEITDDEKDEYIYEAIDEDFRNKINWCLVDKEEIE